MTDDANAAHRHLAPTHWPAEDGGPARLQHVRGVPGPAATSAHVVAVRHDPVCVMAVHATDHRLLLLRNSIGPDGVSWVESLDHETLAARDRSPDLALGPYWPGGLGALADGATVVVQGCHAHRLDPDLGLERSVTLPVEAPHNSFVVLADGSLATKDLQRPGTTASVLSVLDPVTLEHRTAPFALPEASVARLAADGDDVIVVGVTALHRVRWDPSTGGLSTVGSWPYLDSEGTAGAHSFGWDPVVAGGHVWWMDNGDHTFTDGMTMLGNGVAPGAVRLWRADPDGRLHTVEVGGAPAGAITNPPLVDPDRGLVVAFDSANGVMAAFTIADLDLVWRIELNTAQHLVLYPDTGEILANDHDPATGDSLVVVDIADGAIRARAHVGSPAQSVVFPAPGPARDALYVSLSTVARIAFDTPPH